MKKRENLKKTQVGIIIGGNSVEHEISLISGLQAILALDERKYIGHIIYLNKQNEFLVGKDLNKMETYQTENFKNCIRVCFLKDKNKIYLKGIDKRYLQAIDVFIPCVHGKNVEDGTISGFLDTLGAIYTSSGIKGSYIAQDKLLTKQTLKDLRIPFLPFVGIKKSDLFEQVKNKIKKLSYPVIVKPNTLGSSIGISIASNDEELHEALATAFKYDNMVLIERALTNFKEYNCAIYQKSGVLITSSIEEVKSISDIFTYEEKYSSKASESSSHVIPAPIDTKLENEIINYTTKIYQALDMIGVIRIDYLFDGTNLYLNEINSIPGSLAFYLFENKAINFENLLDDLIKEAILEYEKKQAFISSFNKNILFNNNFKQKK